MVDHERADLCAPLKFISDNWDLPYLTDRIAATHNFEHAFAFGRNPRKDARPAPEMMLGSPSISDTYWPEGTNPGRDALSSRARSRCLRTPGRARSPTLRRPRARDGRSATG